MSFDLVVTMPHRPDQLRLNWERAFAVRGFVVEIIPGFELATWDGGFLPIRVNKAPAKFIGVPIAEPIVAGFEIEFEAGSAHLRTAMCRTTTDFALQCIGAATLTLLSDGRYHDGQNGLACDAEAAISAAEREVESFLCGASPDELSITLFPGWDALE